MRMRVCHILILLSMLFTVVFTGCNTSKQAVSSDPTRADVMARAGVEQCYAELIGGYGRWERLRMPVSVRISSPTSLSAGGTVTMERGKSVMLSLRFIGMEVAALYVTDDTIVVVDRMKKRYFAGNTARLLGGFPATVSNLQDILLGRAFCLGAEDIPSSLLWADAQRDEGLSWMLLPKGVPERLVYGFFFSSATELRSMAAGFADKYPVEFIYSDPVVTGAGVMMQNLNVRTSMPKLNIDATFLWNFDKSKWNSDVELRQLKVPESYKRISVDELKKIL